MKFSIIKICSDDIIDDYHALILDVFCSFKKFVERHFLGKSYKIYYNKFIIIVDVKRIYQQNIKNIYFNA